MCAETLSLELPIPALNRVIASSSHTEMKPTHGIRQKLALALGVTVEEVAVGADLMTPLVEILLGADDRAVVAEPTCGRFTNAALNSRGRYIDVGRNHQFVIDSDSVDAALGLGTVTLVYLADPNLPTSTCPASTLIRTSIDAGAHVLVDRRFAFDPLKLSTAERLIGLSSFESSAGLSGVEFMVGPPVLMANLNALELTAFLVDGLSAVLSNPKEVLDRVRRLRRARDATFQMLKDGGIALESPQGQGVWLRIPGTPSEAAASIVNHPHVQGHSAWTWRDAVHIYPCSPDVAQSLLDALTRTA